MHHSKPFSVITHPTRVPVTLSFKPNFQREILKREERDLGSSAQGMTLKVRLVKFKAGVFFLFFMDGGVNSFTS